MIGCKDALYCHIIHPTLPHWSLHSFRRTNHVHVLHHCSICLSFQKHFLLDIYLASSLASSSFCLYFSFLMRVALITLFKTLSWLSCIPFLPYVSIFSTLCLYLSVSVIFPSYVPFLSLSFCFPKAFETKLSTPSLYISMNIL